MRTDIELCVGCNKCIFCCPTHANTAELHGEESKVHVDESLCIYCGKCVDICDHKARVLEDDTEKFFEDLKRGEQISIIAAPSIVYNIKESKNLFGYLKSLGASSFYDVSFGADITTWGYIKALQMSDMRPMIAQPCPVVVSYIESHMPNIRDRLSPVHSPALCLAIYMKKYANVKGKIAFLSPCIAKKVEFDDPSTGGFISYNITYKNLLKHLDNKRVTLLDYAPVEFDNIEGSLGFAFPRPGGLKENVHHYLGSDLWVRQMEDIAHIASYLKEYEIRAKEDKPLPVLFDVLNCVQGCNNGTGTTKLLSIDDIDFEMDNKKSTLPPPNENKLFAHFDEILNYTDFTRQYSDKSKAVERYSNAAVEEIFVELGKFTEAERSINCFSCGFGSCKSFAISVSLGKNHKHNCVRYVRALTEKQAAELRTKNENVTSSLSYASKIQQSLLPSEQSIGKAFKEYELLWKPKDIVGGDIYWAKNFSDGHLVCICDCTGHGTPGALLTMLFVSTLDSVVNEDNYKNPADIIRLVNLSIADTLNVKFERSTEKWNRSTDIRDGADLALIYIDKSGNAKLSSIGGLRTFVCNGSEVTDYKGQKLRLGDGSMPDNCEINVIDIEFSKNNRFLIATDGLFDQIGESTGRPLGYRTVKNVMLENHDLPLKDMFNLLVESFYDHKGNEERRDDLTVLAFTLNGSQQEDRHSSDILIM